MNLGLVITAILLAGLPIVVVGWSPFLKLLGASANVGKLCQYDYSEERVELELQTVSYGCEAQNQEAVFQDITWTIYHLNSSNNFTRETSSIVKTAQNSRSLVWSTNSSDLGVYAVVVSGGVSNMLETVEVSVEGYLVVGCWSVGTGSAALSQASVCAPVLDQVRQMTPAVHSLQQLQNCSQSEVDQNDVCIISSQQVDGGHCGSTAWSYDSDTGTCQSDPHCAGSRCFLTEQKCQWACYQVKTYHVSPGADAGILQADSDLYVHAEGLAVQSDTSIVLQVKGGRDASILLQKLQYDYTMHTIEVRLGAQGNTEASLLSSRTHSVKDTYQESGVLSADEYRWFWISWQNGNVKVGKGSLVGEQEILSWRNKHKVMVSYVSMGSRQGAKSFYRLPASGLSYNTGSKSLDSDISLSIKCLSNCEALASPQLSVELYAEWSAPTCCINHYHWWVELCGGSNLTACLESSMATAYYEERNDRFFKFSQQSGDEVARNYEVHVTGMLNDGVSTSASMMVQFSPVPQAGNCTVGPSSGYALVTNFSLACTGFSVEGTHRLDFTVFLSKTNMLDGTAVRVHHGDSPNESGLKLAVGDREQDYRLYVLVRASLENGASTTTSTSVQVLPTSMSSAGDSLASAVSSILDLSNSGQTSVVSTLLDAGDVSGAVQYLDVVMSSVNDDTAQDEAETRTLVRTAVIASLERSVIGLTSPEAIDHGASVLAKTTQSKTELTDDTQDKATDVVRGLTENFQNSSINTTTSRVKDTAGLLLTSVAQLLDMRTDQGNIRLSDPDNTTNTMDKVKNATEQLLSVASMLSATMLARQVSGQNATSLHTPTLSVAVTRVSAGNVGSAPFLLERDGSEPAQVAIPTNFTDSDGNIGVQLVEVYKNPYIWDESAEAVNLGLFGVELLEDGGSTLEVHGLDVPIAVNIPNNNISSPDNITLTVRLIKSPYNLTFDPSRSNMVTFNFSLEVNKTTSLTLTQFKGIPNLKLYISEEGNFSLDDAVNFGVLIPKQSIQYTLNLSNLDLFTKLESIGQESWTVLFSYNYSGSNNYMGQHYAAITIDPNDNDTFYWLRQEYPSCLGDDLVESCEVDVEVNVQIVTLVQECLYWDTAAQQWSGDGCQVSPFTTPGSLQCLCTHLTSFSGGVFVLPNFVDPIADAALFLTLFDNPVVVTAVIIVWMIYFFLIHWARRADRLDQEKLGVVWVGEHDNKHSHLYLMCVVTGWWADAGSSANVFCYVRGSRGSSARYKLSTCLRPCFQTGFEDWFVLAVDASLGQLHSVCFWHDNSGTSPHWYLSQVYIKDLQTRESWVFIYNNWLAADRGSLRQTIATLPAVTKSELNGQRKHNFTVKSTRDLRDGHLWISIFSKPARSTFTRVQRLTCALSLLLTTMLTNIMFYGIPTDDPQDQVGGGKGLTFSLSAIVIGIESSLLMFPINLIILQLFLKIKPRPSQDGYELVKINNDTTGNRKRQQGDTETLKSRESETNQTIDNQKGRLDNRYQRLRTGVADRLAHWRYLFARKHVEEQPFDTVICQDSVQSTSPCDGVVAENGVHPTQTSHTPSACEPNMSTSLLKSATSKVTFISETKSDGKILPWWFVYIAWCLVVTVSLVSSYFVMLYGLKYGYQTSVEWLISFLTGFTQSAFITQPIKVFAVAMVITLVLKKAVEFEDYGPDIRVDRDEELVSALCGEAETHIPYTEPLSTKLLEEIKQRLHMEWLMNMTLRDLGLYLLYLGVVLVVVHGHRDVHSAYKNTQTLEDVLVNPGCVDPALCFHLSKVDRVETFYQYLTGVAVPSLADMSVADHDYATPGSSHFLLGPWRLRQLRVKTGSCVRAHRELMSLFDMALPECTDEYWVTAEDTGSYNNSWSLPVSGSMADAASMWTYQSSWKLKTIPSPGQLATYSGGGYVLTMPHKSSLHKGVLDDVKTTDWLDERTRAVFLECTIYNPNADIFSIVKIIFEFSNNGAVLPSHQIFSTRLYHYSTDFAKFVAACEVLFLCFNLGFMYVERKRYKVLGRSEYFKDFWSYVELVQIALAISVIGLFFQRLVSVNSVIDAYRASDGRTYISFYTAISWDMILGYLMGFLVAVVTLKAIKLLKFNRRAFLVGDTLFHSKHMIASFIFMAVVFGLAFAHFCMMAFGKWISGYKDIYSSLMTIFNFALGVSDLPSLQEANRYLGPAYFVVFVVVAQFCFLTIFVAIVNFGISDSKAVFEQRKNKFELFDYVKTKVKTIANIR